MSKCVKCGFSMSSFAPALGRCFCMKDTVVEELRPSDPLVYFKFVHKSGRLDKYTFIAYLPDELKNVQVGIDLDWDKYITSDNLLMPEVVYAIHDWYKKNPNTDNSWKQLYVMDIRQNEWVYDVQKETWSVYEN